MSARPQEIEKQRSSEGGFRRSARSARGEARRKELLERITDDLAANGLVDFSLRRAARAAGTTHKVLLYHFADVDDLLRQALALLRERRIESGIAAATQAGLEKATLGRRVEALWSVLTGPDSWVHDQAIGLMMYDPVRYGELGAGSSEQYLSALIAMCPPSWAEGRKREVAHMILATLRGFVIDRLASKDPGGVEEGFRALLRSLEREESPSAAGAASRRGGGLVPVAGQERGDLKPTSRRRK
jgi:AcrR family transcriptional regulator